MRRVSRIAFLTTIWVLLWGDLSVANVLTGAFVSWLLMVLNPDHRWDGGTRSLLRPVAIAELVAYLVVQLVRSNLLVLREIVRRRSRVRTAIVGCHLNVPSDRIMTFMANVLSLSPGTIPVELRSDPPRLLIHVFDLRDPVELRRSVAHLERLLVEAFGTAEERALLTAAVAAGPVRPEVAP
ncbi:MAG: Na+/H+ antiporter subunit E [Actinobacteria bacterium]|nr:Na+/H+ antiporter subunit E [Actinomycetota bacterium]